MIHQILTYLWKNESMCLQMSKLTLQREKCQNISHYLGTGRVSVKWMIRIKPKDDNMRIALLAPPDDVKKLRKVKQWVQYNKA